jgi:hypothetical protein
MAQLKNENTGNRKKEKVMKNNGASERRSERKNIS